MKSQIIVKRYPYEEPYLTQLEFIVSNGIFSGHTNIYFNVEDLGKIGRALQSFPKNVDDEYIYEYGSEKPEERFYRHFWLKVYVVNSLGQCAIQFHINRNTEEPDEGICRFSILAEAAAVNNLGKLFEEFSRLKHLEFRWSQKESELFKTHQIEEKLWQS
jgi:hypothetical protein